MRNFLIILCLGLAFFSCKENYTEQVDKKEAPKTKTQAVKLTTVGVSNDPIPIAVSGIIGSKAEVNLSFKVSGFIQNLYAKETQYVKKGQVLANLRTTEIDAQVAKAKQAVQKAERDLVRIKKMYADTAATLENVEDLTTQLNVAKSDLAIAEYNQQYATIRAPISGKVLKRFTENNELVNPGMPIFRIASSNEKGYVLNFGVADIDVVKIKLGDPANVAFDAYPNQLFTANVTEIAAAADPRTGAFPIELTVNKLKGKSLRNGFIGKVTLFPSNQEAYIKIPIDALVEGYKNRANIYTIKEDKAQKVSVQPTYIGSDFFTVSPDQLGGISQIVTDGAAYLKDGLAIKIIKDKVDTMAEIR